MRGSSNWCVYSLAQLPEQLTEVRPGAAGASRRDAKQVKPSGKGGLKRSKHGFHPPTERIANDGATDRGADSECHSRWQSVTCRHPAYPNRTDSGLSCRPRGKARERLPVLDGPDQADSFSLPLARRALRMARPARVDIRWRNPCFLDRLRLFGWKVLFTRNSSTGRSPATSGHSGSARSYRLGAYLWGHGSPLP
jgi:hypothetical protein